MKLQKNVAERKRTSMITSHRHLNMEEKLKHVKNIKHHYQKRGYEIFALQSYLPQRFDATNEEVQTRALVYNFKDGIPHATRKVAVLVSNFISENFDTNENNVLMVIPASTAEKNITRFSIFSRMVCSGTGLQNGIDGISILQDRETHKGLTGINKIENLSFCPNTFRNKHVILFDDVITSGGSFSQVANALIEKGAKKVTGVFLAKTIHKW